MDSSSRVRMDSLSSPERAVRALCPRGIKVHDDELRWTLTGGPHGGRWTNHHHACGNDDCDERPEEKHAWRHGLEVVVGQVGSSDQAKTYRVYRAAVIEGGLNDHPQSSWSRIEGQPQKVKIYIKRWWGEIGEIGQLVLFLESRGARCHDNNGVFESIVLL